MLGGLVLLLAIFEAFSLGFYAVIAEFVLASLALWSVGSADLLAVVVMAYYPWCRHWEAKGALAEGPGEQASNICERAKSECRAAKWSASRRPSS